METIKKRTSITWHAAEHHHLEKGAGWYLIIGGSALVLLVVALFMKDFFFAVLIVLSAVLVMVFGSNPPRVYEFRVDERGVQIGKRMRGWSEFTSFSVRKHQHEPRELVLRTKSNINPFLHLPMERRTLHDVHALLASKLKETEFEESAADIIADILGF